MALPDSIKWKLKKFKATTPEHKKILREFEEEYNKAVSDGNVDEIRRLIVAFEEAWRLQKKRKEELGYSDPFEV